MHEGYFARDRGAKNSSAPRGIFAMILYRMIYQMVMVLLRFLNGAHPKLEKGYALRQKQNGVYPWLLFPKHTEPLWFHCASGEFEYALPVIRKIKERHPEQKILVTYFTPSYLPRLTQEALVDYLCPSPWDSPGVMREFIEHHRPKALLIARTDVWTEMTKQCVEKNIPTSLFSMTFNKDPGFFAKLFYSWQLRFVNTFFVVSEEDKKKLSRVVSAARITVAGDTRYEQCLYRLQQGEKRKPNIKVDPELLSKKLFVAGSLWAEDEEVLLEVMKLHREKYHWILVPHEVHEDHLIELSEKINAIGERAVLSDNIHTWTGKGVLIINEFGLLAHLYKLAHGSFVGGSFKKSVHSVMEPLATGSLTFVGPHYHNNREAEEFAQLKSPFPISPVQVVTRLSFSTELQKNMELWDETAAENLRQLFLSKAHATDRILSQLRI
jgi:3-deoxy-D-manno-octulosonic-acid transferase